MIKLLLILCIFLAAYHAKPFRLHDEPIVKIKPLLMKATINAYSLTKDDEKWAPVWDSIEEIASKTAKKAFSVEMAKRVNAGKTEQEAEAELEAEGKAKMEEALFAVKIEDKKLKEEVKKKVLEGKKEKEAEEEVMEEIKMVLKEEEAEQMEDMSNIRKKNIQSEVEKKVAEGMTEEQAETEVEEEAAVDQEAEAVAMAHIRDLALAAQVEHSELKNLLQEALLAELKLADQDNGLVLRKKRRESSYEACVGCAFGALLYPGCWFILSECHVVPGRQRT